MLNLIKGFMVSLLVVVFTVLFIVMMQKHQNIVKESPTVLSLSDLHIEPLKSSKQPVPNFASYINVEVKKRTFFAYLLPEIRRQNDIVKKEREMVLALTKTYAERQVFSSQEIIIFEKLKQKYKLNAPIHVATDVTLLQLMNRVDVIPEKLILVQAANESGWGTSRFATQGYNFFGLWCFKKGCGFVPRQRNNEAEHEVARFKDLAHSIMTYIRNLNRLYAYQELREIRAQLRHDNKPITAKALANGLISYSERGQDYIDELQSMLRVNDKYMEMSL